MKQLALHHELHQGDCLGIMPTLGTFDCVFADPFDNIGLGYDEHDDRIPEYDYIGFLEDLTYFSAQRAPIVWLSFNAKWTFAMGEIFSRFLLANKEWEAKACVQVFTFGQHNKNDLGNNHRPLWRLKHKDAPLYPEQIKIPSWRQMNGDKRAAPGGRVPGDVSFEPRYRHSTLPIPNLSLEDTERLLAKINKVSEAECWEWIGSKREGYGRFRVGGREGHAFTVTRLVWRMVYGSDPGDQLVLHSCDNPGCCNPSHLFLGTDRDNNLDKESKRRAKHPIGNQNGLAKLTDLDVLAIYRSQESNVALASQYNVTDSCIVAIRSGKTWRHVTQVQTNDVFYIPRVTGNSAQRRKWHPTQLGEELVERCIKLSTPEYGRVLDPFGGTGTTLRACKNTNRSCTLIEKSAGYCDHIRAEHPDLSS